MSTLLEPTYKNIDIWYEATQVEDKVYERERQILKLHIERMQADWDKKNKNQLSSVFEYWEDQPIRFFKFLIDGKHYCGRKLLSPIVTEHGSPGFFCSLIKTEMLLGEFVRSQVSQQGVEIFYKEMSVKERVDLFEKLKSNRSVDIYHPFVHLSAKERLEINTPENGWFITEERANLLSIGEEHLRKISTLLVKTDKLERPIVYDPACSTGKFLSAIKRENPNAVVIGQDLSPEMCKWAESKLDKIIVGNSFEPGMPHKSCDYIFFRFLNAEVVATQFAKILFERIILCLKDDGKAILFGHTPVLVPSSFIENMGYSILSCNEYIASESAVLQYYVIQRRR